MGCVLDEDRAAEIAFGELEEDDFYCKVHWNVFERLRKHWEENKTLERLTLPVDFRGETDKYVSGYYTGYLIEKYIATLRRYRADRTALEAAKDLELAALAHQGADALGVYTRECETEGLEHLEAEMQAEADGKRFALEFPKYPMLSRTKALLPGSITVFCGSPGASKSLFMLECLWRWFFGGVHARCLMLEKGVPFHMRRVLAQLTEEARMTDDRFVSANTDTARALAASKRESLARLEGAKVIQAPRAKDEINVDYLLKWLQAQAHDSVRVCIVDPVTIMDASSRPWEDHKRFVREAGRIVTSFKMSLICVTHPKSAQAGRCTPSLDNVSGGRAWREFSDSVFWLEAHADADATVKCADGLRGTATFNRTIHLLKTRLGWGSGQRLAVQFDSKSLCHTESGQILD